MSVLKSSKLEPLEFYIDLHKSKQLLRMFVDTHNENKPLKDQIRANHLALMAELLEIYRISLWRQQAPPRPSPRGREKGQALVPGSPLPYFWVNNVQLGRLMLCTDRSIQNLRHRLKAAKLIVDEIWHGSSCSYEMRLNPAVIYLARIGDKANHAHLFGTGYPVSGTREEVLVTAELGVESQRKQGDENAPYGEKNSNSTEKFSSNCPLSFLNTNKLNQWDLGKCGKAANADEIPVSEESRGTLAGYETISDVYIKPPRVAAAPPERDLVRGRQGEVAIGAPSACGISPRGEQFRDAMSKNASEIPPETFSEVVSELPDKLGRAIFREVNQVWELALKELYDGEWIADTERERAKARLAEYYIYASPKKYEVGTEEICERIRLVRKWIDRGIRENQERWVPIPSVYFDYRNHRGFGRTKAWYKKHLEKRAEIGDKVALARAVKKYKLSLGKGRVGDSGLTTPMEIYKRLLNNLRERNEELVGAFQRAVLGVEVLAC